MPEEEEADEEELDWNEEVAEEEEEPCCCPTSELALGLPTVSKSLVSSAPSAKICCCLPVGGEVGGLLMVKVGGGARLLSSLSGLELDC